AAIVIPRRCPHHGRFSDGLSGRTAIGCLFFRSSRIYFFFQAEDGIRDRNVTGVQTCALPIFRRRNWTPPYMEKSMRWRKKTSVRSEERRVGKEWRSRGWANHQRKMR